MADEGGRKNRRDEKESGEMPEAPSGVYHLWGVAPASSWIKRKQHSDWGEGRKKNKKEKESERQRNKSITSSAGKGKRRANLTWYLGPTLRQKMIYPQEVWVIGKIEQQKVTRGLIFRLTLKGLNVIGVSREILCGLRKFHIIETDVLRSFK